MDGGREGGREGGACASACLEQACAVGVTPKVEGFAPARTLLTALRTGRGRTLGRTGREGTGRASRDRLAGRSAISGRCPLSLSFSLSLSLSLSLTHKHAQTQSDFLMSAFVGLGSLLRVRV